MAKPSPMSMIPAFSSPAPTRIFGDFVGNVLSRGRLFLYEQCSLHITEKMPSSVYDGSRPRMALSFSYSSGVRLCFWTNSGVMAGSVIGIGKSKLQWPARIERFKEVLAHVRPRIF